MVFRSLGLIAVFVAILVIVAEHSGCARGNDGRQEISSVTDARARFLTRIREMLGEAARMEEAGRPQDAMLVAVRASRMLGALGGESAWPRGETSPAQVVALLADRHGPGATLQKAPVAIPSRQDTRLTAESEPGQRGSTKKAISDQPDLTPTGKATDAFSRFPVLPAASRSWVPVGKPTTDAGEWTPVGAGSRLGNDGPVKQAGVEFPTPPATKSGRTGPPQIPVFGPGGAGIDAAPAGISDRQVALIPVHLTPTIRPAAGVDIHADDEPQELPIAADSIPIRDLLPDSAAESQRSVILDDASALPVNKLQLGRRVAEVSQPESREVDAAGSRLLLATLAGAAGGVLLVLVGGFLVRRIDRSSQVPAVSLADKGASALSAAQPKVAPIKSVVVSPAEEVCWQPGSSWVDSASDPAPMAHGGNALEVDAVDSKPANGPQLQIYHETPDATAEPATEVDEVEGAHAAPAVRGETGIAVAPIVPFRVVGTSVVLGEAESAQVDEELQQRRQRIMKAVFDENVARQSSLDNNRGDEAA